MPRNEHTSPALTSEAGRYANASDAKIAMLAITNPGLIRSAFASPLTQARDRGEKPA